MSAESETSVRRYKRRAGATLTTQLGLFDAPQPVTPPEPAPQPEEKLAPMPPASVDVAKRKQSRRPNPRDAQRTLTIEDMPDYPPELQEAVDRMLSDFKSEHMLMTYRAIRECFGISRATVARRVKDGLVPGVSIAHGRVLEEGPVRRFDRTQVRWLLLAVRYGARRTRA